MLKQFKLYLEKYIKRDHGSVIFCAMDFALVTSQVTQYFASVYQLNSNLIVNGLRRLSLMREQKYNRSLWSLTASGLINLMTVITPIIFFLW